LEIYLIVYKLVVDRPRKFTYGNKRLESTKEALIKNQAFEILVLYYAFDFLMATLTDVLKLGKVFWGVCFEKI